MIRNQAVGREPSQLARAATPSVLACGGRLRQGSHGPAARATVIPGQSGLHACRHARRRMRRRPVRNGHHHVLIPSGRVQGLRLVLPQLAADLRHSGNDSCSPFSQFGRSRSPSFLAPMYRRIRRGAAAEAPSPIFLPIDLGGGGQAPVLVALEGPVHCHE